jgi:hypothetical protein
MPSIPGFDATTGSAPDFFYLAPYDTSVFGTCSADVVMQLVVHGSAFPSCYKLFIKAGTNSYTCQTNATGACPAVTCDTQNEAVNMSAGICDVGGQFAGGATTVVFEVSKTCPAAMSENVTFTIYGHF